MNLPFPSLSKDYRILRITEQEIEDVYQLCAQNPHYYQHCPPPVSREGILKDLSALPPGVPPSDKYYVGLYQDRQLIAVLDLILGYPTASDAYIGFFMTNASIQRRGIGTAIIQNLCRDLSRLHFHSVHLSWVKGNQQAEQFWLKNGFSAVRETNSTSALPVIAAERRLEPEPAEPAAPTTQTAKEASMKQLIHNPILPGFHADPCICRKKDDFYLAVSSFEWFPGIPIYHSRDLMHWELYAHALTNDNQPDLKKLPSAKGIWAPCLTYCETEDLFYVVYGVMNSMNARYFDVDNFLITAKDPKGPWSEPVYLHSTGFDASLFHDEDGRKYIAALEWETRASYEKPGPICLMEYDPIKKQMVGMPKRIWRGGTDRGCIEAPHLTKHGDYYYLMCAEGGTGYYHSVTMGRAKEVWGPYEADPCNPILTSNPTAANERADWDHLKPRYYNPHVTLQKAGHGSYVDLPNGETWMVFHVSRPFLPELRCPLGRETAIQRMQWTNDGWLRTESGNNLAEEFVTPSALSKTPFPSMHERTDSDTPTMDNSLGSGRQTMHDNSDPASLVIHDDFDSASLALGYYAPRIDPASFADLTARPGWVRLRGQESGCSLNKVSLLARKLTSVLAVATTKMDFTPLCYQHTAGLILYYDNMNFLYLHKYFSETLNHSALGVLQLENGVKTMHHAPDRSRIFVADEKDLCLRLTIRGRDVQFSWAYADENYENIGPVFDLGKLSDEYSEYGEFTGTFIGITCGDRMMHKHTADFDFFDYQADAQASVT